MKMPVLGLTALHNILRQLTSVFANDAISLQYSIKAIIKTIGKNCVASPNYLPDPSLF